MAVHSTFTASTESDRVHLRLEIDGGDYHEILDQLAEIGYEAVKILDPDGAEPPDQTPAGRQWGYYRIKVFSPESRWVLAEYDAEGFWLPGHDKPYDEDALCEIGDRIEL